MLRCLPAIHLLSNSDLLIAPQLTQSGWHSDKKPAWKPLQDSVMAKVQCGWKPETGKTRPRQQVPLISFQTKLYLISFWNVNSFAPHHCAAHNHSRYFNNYCSSLQIHPTLVWQAKLFMNTLCTTRFKSLCVSTAWFTPTHFSIRDLKQF